MLKLFYAPGACSISPHIALREAGIPFELARVDFMRGKKLDDGSDFTSVNPKGYVPAMYLDNGELLTEGVAMLQYIADLKPEKKLAPPPSSFERVRLQEWLNFIATELHKGLSPLYAKEAPDEYKAVVRARIETRLGQLAKGVEGKRFLMGEDFTIADGYAFYVMRSWRRVFKGELSAALSAYYDRIASRPAVQETLKAEGFTTG